MSCRVVPTFTLPTDYEKTHSFQQCSLMDICNGLGVLFIPFPRHGVYNIVNTVYFRPVLVQRLKRITVQKLCRTLYLITKTFQPCNIFVVKTIHIFTVQMALSCINANRWVPIILQVSPYLIFIIASVHRNWFAS